MVNEALACSMNCKNKPTYECDCSDKQVFLCSEHLGEHGESVGKHHFTKIMKNIDPQAKIIIYGLLRGLKLQAKQNRFKIVQESSLLIKQINEATTKSLEKLLSIEKKLDEYTYLCHTLQEVNNSNSKSFIELLLKLSAEDASKIKFQEDIIKINSKSFKDEIENLFTVKETKDLFEIDNIEAINPIKTEPIIKYFRGEKLFAVNLVSQQFIPLNINKNQELFDPTCLLKGGSIFCCFQSETFIITQNNSIITFDSYQYSCNSGLIAVDDFVYMIGGTGNASFKFSLKSKKWEALAEYPVPNNRFISCAFINNEILIAGFESPYVSVYNISKNLYNNAPITLNSNTGKTCLATKNKAYVIDHNRNCYESGFNDINTWTSIKAHSAFSLWINPVFSEGNPHYSYSLLFEDSFYFITCDYRLIQFNLKNKQLKNLKILK
ncbi:unnamed protein product [Blepharisma stoltei]|uniref:Uncharacterized protein n=1 Tax=Blepharisma stoltei TaxID=1481888 RepID=A0AAU9ICB1_9CILI|nr:unnamed protein product [Blepharisma stoltei]